jgi:deoxycytidine triphosphate deaminase
MTQLDFATLESEAAARAAKFLSLDPFQSIPPSLLSSAEIHDYVRVTSLIHPFSSTALRSSSYDVHIGGDFIYWDAKGDRINTEVKRGSRCVLPANSLSFIQVEPYFRLPNYIALHFSLRMQHMHRGLLMCTGAQIEPGFSGKLLIPIHNLTATNYDIDTTQPLISIEFTKTTFGAKPVESEASLTRHLVAFPPTELNLSPEVHLRKANAGNPIRSILPAEIATAKQSAREAALWARTIALGASAGVVLAVIGLALALYGYAGQVQVLYQSTQASTVRMDALATEIAEISGKLSESSQAVERRIGDDLEARLRLLKEDVDKKADVLEAEFRSSSDLARSTLDGQGGKLNFLDAEIQRLRGLVEKKR